MVRPPAMVSSSRSPNTELPNILGEGLSLARNLTPQIPFPSGEGDGAQRRSNVLSPPAGPDAIG